MAARGIPVVGLDTERSISFFTLTLIFFALAVVFVTLRIYSCQLRKKGFGLDDYLIFAALVSVLQQLDIETGHNSLDLLHGTKYLHNSS